MGALSLLSSEATHTEGQRGSSSGVGGTVWPPKPSDRGCRLPGGARAPRLYRQARPGWAPSWWDEHPGGLSAPKEAGCLLPEVLTCDLEHLSSPVHTQKQSGSLVMVCLPLWLTLTV